MKFYSAHFLASHDSFLDAISVPLETRDESRNAAEIIREISFTQEDPLWTITISKSTGRDQADRARVNRTDALASINGRGMLD